ncbi:MAG: biopolymer transporter ExbD [Bdellovibrionales bacterium]|nr:biopolymer transporter ExbD [Bdellovibrionales bacterium]
MGIQKPGYHLKAAHDLPHLRKRLKGGRGGSRIIAELNLTSMIDLFSVIILFLIQSFSATGEILIMNKDVTLPAANHGQELTRSPIITVMSDKVTLEGAPVGENSNIQDKIEETDWDLPQLTRRLEDYKKFYESINPDKKFPSEVIVQADKKLNFVYLKRVMYSLVKRGYTNINLAVRGQAEYRQPEPPAGTPPAAGGR